MGNETGIEWTNSTWTPIRARNTKTGKIGWHCEHVSPGCEHCYSETLNIRLGTKRHFRPGILDQKQVEVFLDEQLLTQPLRWKRPRRIFVCSMTDLFARFVTDEMLDRVFAVMALAHQHEFQVLTKRGDRMREYLGGGYGTAPGRIWARAMELGGKTSIEHRTETSRRLGAWPLPNVWCGVSCEDQRRANERIPELLQTPAAVRFISAEPLLGPIDLTALEWAGDAGHDGQLNALTGTAACLPIRNTPVGAILLREPGARLDWVIVGGESGPKARPMALGWAEGIIDQCAAAGVACFIKQLGERPTLRHSVPFAHHAGEPTKRGDPQFWPESLRVRQMPEGR